MIALVRHLKYMLAGSSPIVLAYTVSEQACEDFVISAQSK